MYSTISFNIAHYGVKGHSFVAPRMGILYEMVETLLFQVSDLGCYRCPNFPTISEHVGYILPCNCWMEWDLFAEDSDFNSKVIDLQDKIQLGTEIFKSRFSDLSSVISYVETLPYGSAFQELLIRLPIMYYIVGEKDKGIRFITSVCREHPENVIFSAVFMTNYNALP